MNGREETLSVLKKGILAYLKKGYSVQAVVETINGKFPEFEITDADVRKILPKVTRKKRAASTTAKTNDIPESKDRQTDKENSRMENGTGSRSDGTA